MKLLSTRFIKSIAAGFIMVLSFSVTAIGSESYRTIYVNMKDGSRVGVSIKENLTIGSDDNYTLSFYYPEYTEEEGYKSNLGFAVAGDKIAGLEMSTDYSSLDRVEAIITPILSKSELRIAGLQSPARLVVSTVDGVTLFNREINDEITIDLRHYGTGIYLINLNGVTYKYYVR